MKKFKEKSTDITYPRVGRSNLGSSNSLSTNELTELYSNINPLVSNLDSNNPEDILNNFRISFEQTSDLSEFLGPQTSNNYTMADALKSTVILLKTFDGTPTRLETFVNQIDTFYTRYFNADPSQQEYVILAIKSKIIGAAEDFLLTRSDLNTWAEIKIALQQKFTDPITRVNLQQQLIFLSKKNESTQDYIQKLKALVTKINNKICSEIANIEARRVLIAQNELTATQNLLANISSELRTLLIVQNPQNLDHAIDVITNYEILTSQNHFKNNYLQNHNLAKQNVQRTPNQFSGTQQKMPNNQFRMNFPKQNPTNQSRPPNQHFNKQQGQFFRPPNQSFFKPQNQNFAQKNTQYSKPQQYPQPMSGVSIQPRKPVSQVRHQQSYFKPTGKPNFAFQELTNLENEEGNFEFDNESQNNPEFDEYDNYQNYQNFEDQTTFEEENLTEQLENFQLEASDKVNTI